MDESTAFAVRRKVAGGRILETFDNRLERGQHLSRVTRRQLQMLSAYRLSRSIVTDDQCERSVELDSLAAGIIEGANSV